MSKNIHIESAAEELLKEVEKLLGSKSKLLSFGMWEPDLLNKTREATWKLDMMEITIKVKEQKMRLSVK